MEPRPNRVCSIGARRGPGVRGDGDPADLARIQPVHQTTLARVDDDVAWPAVKMADHRLAARGTVEDSLAWTLAARQRRAKRARFTNAHGIDDRRELIHVDQHLEAAPAAEQGVAFQATHRERGGARRAHCRRRSATRSVRSPREPPAYCRHECRQRCRALHRAASTRRSSRSWP